MSKYSYIALLLAMIIGILAGGFFQSHKYEKELESITAKHKKELVQKVKQSKDSINTLSIVIKQQDSLLTSNKEKISKLEQNITKQEQIIDKKREEVKKLTNKEKVIWITNRYDFIPTSKDSVTISDPVAAMVIDELLVKDLLTVKVNSLDSIITVYQQSDSINTEKSKEYAAKEVEYKSIVSNLEELSNEQIKENKDLKRRVRNKKIKNTILKLGMITEGVLIIALIL